ncbi:histidine kinase N-terminal 7TM domain-containing protein [Haloarchaeobius sp. HME9146]|uniref:sensor histidine kinase n=1 Tax=Haloarchaeobius sp. HME9146 TaxID=2978732 RepID=UPI0021C246CE|nr:histidine kinase N-terminal 7TM domain-containing protein [Haloarchaeobius sp. HME9146]MCT9097687.1 ATP-binding protein [Haloarchaeobius sp. HME9146]
MGFQPTPLTIPLVLGAFIQAVLALYVLSRRDGGDDGYDGLPGASVAAGLLLAVSLMMVAYAAELSVVGQNQAAVREAKVQWNMVQYLGMGAIPGLWLCYVARFIRFDGIPRLGWAAIAAGAVATPIVVLTNPLHHQFWTAVSLESVGGSAVLVNEHGIAFYAFTAYAYLLVLSATALLARAYAESTGLYRRQVAGLLAGSLAPFAASALYLFGPEAFGTYNLTAFGFFVTAGAVAWSVLRNRLFQLRPVARRTAVEQMKDPAIVLDVDDRILDYNPAAIPLFEGDDPTGRLADEASTVPFDGDTGALVTVTDGDGETGHYEHTRTALTDGAGDIGSLVIFRDVTDRVRRERELRRQNERLDQFASVVSHDLRNPLSTAKGYLDLYRESGVEDHADAAERAHDRMETIVQDLLSLARDGGAVTSTEAVEVATAAERAWESVADDGATLRITGDTTVEADRGRVLRLFENLFRNAVEHGSTGSRAQPGDAVEHGSAGTRTLSGDAVEDGRADLGHQLTDGGDGSTGDPLQVSVGPLPDGTGFYVADDGVGLPEDLRENAFQSGVTSSEHGTGLGLAIVSSIAEAHGWQVRATSSDEGGARFEIRVDADTPPN